jgi:hypothetical protein
VFVLPLSFLRPCTADSCPPRSFDQSIGSIHTAAVLQSRLPAKFGKATNMDDRRFDHLSRALASSRSRRQVLKSLLGFGAATVAGGLGSGSANAARRPTPTPKPATCPGLQVSSGSGCVCPEGRSVCGPDCCDTPAACCDNACCPDGTVCIGEELCCPAEAMCGGVCCLNGRCFGGVCCDAAFVCGDTCCNAPGFQCCDSSCKQCCSDAHCASTEYCSRLCARMQRRFRLRASVDRLYSRRLLGQCLCRGRHLRTRVLLRICLSRLRERIDLLPVEHLRPRIELMHPQVHQRRADLCRTGQSLRRLPLPTRAMHQCQFADLPVSNHRWLCRQCV